MRQPDHFDGPQLTDRRDAPVTAPQCEGCDDQDDLPLHDYHAGMRKTTRMLGPECTAREAERAQEASDRAFYGGSSPQTDLERAEVGGKAGR